MDDEGTSATGDLAGAGKVAESIEKITREVRSLAAAFLVPAAEEAGELLGNQVAFWKFRNQLRLFESTIKILKDRGISPNAVDKRLLFPIVEMERGR